MPQAMALKRMTIAVPVGIAVTFGLFALMTYLIGRGEEALVDDAFSGSIEFLRAEREEQSETKERSLPDRLTPPAPPPPPPMTQSESLRPDAGGIDIEIPAFDGSLAAEGGLALGVAANDGDIMPLVRVAPQYPPRAAAQGIEGWVEVEFTISKTGSVQDPKVVQAEPSSIFNRAAIRAIGRWKYKPQIIDGEPRDRPGVRVVLTFVLEGEQ